MIALARSGPVKRRVQASRAGSALATRYVAGGTAESGLERARRLLTDKAIRSSLFFLGEYVDHADGVAENLAAKLEVSALLGQAGLDVHVSVDPTQIGHLLDVATARRHAFAIAEAVARSANDRPGVHVLMLDMEDQSVTDATIALHDEMQDAGLPVALTLQAYLHRTEADLRRQIGRGSRVRLVKGAFVAGPDVAFTRDAEIKANSRRLISLMLSGAAREREFYPVVATHDARLHEHAIACARENGWASEGWEFEMLLGVRGGAAEALAAAGHRVRLYVPFGRNWWPHAVRRIGENPRNAALLARSLLGRT